jgi:transposase
MLHSIKFCKCINLDKAIIMDMKIRREIVRQLLNTDYSNHHIARNVDVAPNTVRRHRKVLKRIGILWADVKDMSDSGLDALFNKKRLPLPHKRQPDWAYVHTQMSAHKHQTLVQLWDEYCLIEPSSAYSQSQFNHYYRQYIKRIDISMRQVHYAGECVYVDYAGKTIPWTNSESGEKCFAQVFVGVLGCSQYTFAFASKSQKLEDFIEAHNKMFAFYGGIPQVIVPDNLKSAVTTPGKFPVINQTYLDLSRHYDCVIEPARVRRPQDKSLAEIGVLLVTRWITVALRRREFFSVDEINDAILALLPKVNDRPFKRMDGTRSSRFEQLDKPLLSILPAAPFEFGKWVMPQVVNSDHHVMVNNHSYSVPYQYRAKKVSAWVTCKTVEFVHDNKRIATHPRSDEIGGATTLMIHRPAHHQAYAKQNYEHYSTWANTIGEDVIAAVDAQFVGKNSYAMTGNKACSQLQSLAKLYGHERFEAACACANEIGSLTVKSIRSILQCKIDMQTHDKPDQTQLPLHHNVRGSDYYQHGGH